MKTQASQLLRNRRGVVALIAAMALLLLVPAGASATSPALEFVVPGHNLSEVSFTTESGIVSAQMAGFEVLVHCTSSHGQGKITGPRSTVSEYQFTGCTAAGGSTKCKSGVNEEEITTGPIESDLVWIDQAKGQVGILMNPSGIPYIKFTCGGEPAEGKGSFLAPVSPLNHETTSFTATLSQAASVQTPDQYEGEKGEALYAFPTGEREGKSFVPTGVEATFTITSSLSGYIKAVTAQEIEAEQLEEEAKKQEETLQKQEATLKKLEEALKKSESEAKKHEEELDAQIAAIKKRQEEEVAAVKKKQEEAENAKSKSSKRTRLLENALKKCKRDKSKSKRVRCEKAANNKYGAKGVIEKG